jgi:HAD superfamily hydrolase (TIGR01549 family)
MNRGPYDAWLIDLDGTLYRQTPVRWLMAMELLVCGPHHIRSIQCFRREQERMRREPGDSLGSSNGSCCPYRTQLDRAAASLGCTPERLAPVIQEWMERRPGKWLRLFCRRPLLAEIAQFRAAGGRTALVSDYPATAKLAGLGVAALFDAVVASGEEGGPATLKPDPAGYLLAAQRLNLPPARCLVIGDREDADGQAARRAAMAFRLVR